LIEVAAMKKLSALLISVAAGWTPVLIYIAWVNW
jgi:hypothetical protein